jgi:hypothetical protein
MRTASSLAYPEVRAVRHQDGWLQAGLKSSAYRLAHLVLPRSVYVTMVAAVFYFV